MTITSLKDKTVLVTGGARGIGKGIALACLEEGARVVITNLDVAVGKDTEAELSSLGSIRALRCDGTDRAAVAAMMDDVWDKEGPIDVVFSNAGRGASVHTLEASIEEVNSLFATNYDSAINLAQSYVPRMVALGRPGHIMFTGSEHCVGLPAGNEALNFGFYGATKHALLALAEWLRADTKGTPVSVSLLMPGPVLTEGLASTFKILDADPDNAQIRQQFSKEVETLLRARIISTQQCAQIALKGLKLGLFYIPTQSYIKSDVDRRHQELENSFAALSDSMT
ncbi:MAG: NAD(P)-dependent dehydrogenase (short-subunit alcohol dehydrogenase family) [Candidatus Azotimanducaceae bacterium]|jgi:NAD(P)-dependent dehydrogenase (short-subunit alcohol dehydrogenase family)